MATESGMSFIGNRWVFTGSQRYVVESNSTGTGYVVMSVNAAGKRCVAVVSTRTKAQQIADALSR